ncbi:MAG: dihydropyrimidinase [Bacillota bacterium]|nr:dihydropyrimidinase [Bacillota bacterium]
MKLLIKNAKIIKDSREEVVDLLISQGKIEKIAKDIEDLEADVISAENKLVLPGGVDVHTHMELDLGNYISVDDFYSGTRAAAFGGTTSIVDHIGFGPRGSSLQAMVDKYYDLGKKSIIDYSFHGAIQEVEDSHLQEFQGLYDQGIVSLKIYTTYGGKLTDDQILKVLKKAKETGTVVCVHCENDGAIKTLRDQAEKEGRLDPIYHAKTRPAETEAEAINRLTYLSQMAGCPKLYIVHVSSGAGLREIQLARQRGVENLYCETCPQYLFLDEDKYLEGGPEEGVKYIMAPPLRKKTDQEALWAGLGDGSIDVVATDHCPFFYQRDKLPHAKNFLTCPGGGPGVEERLELLISAGLKRGLSLESLVQVLCTNPAKIFGLYPQKGSLEVGADGDLVLLEKKSYVISQDNRHSKVDYTSYQGFEVDYRVSTVISRGEIIVDQGKLLGQKARGQFIKRRF